VFNLFFNIILIIHDFTPLPTVKRKKNCFII